MDNVLENIKTLSSKYNIQRVVVFGSRARGDHTPVSDYDIAVYAQDLSEYEKAAFSLDIEEIDTLKKIDILFVDNTLNPELLKSIITDGVVIYEQV